MGKEVIMEEMEGKKLLIVEGVEDERFFSVLLKCLQIADIKILPVGGKFRIHDNLRHLALHCDFSKVISLGIIRDADDNPSGAFDSVCTALEKAKLPVPQAPLIITEGDLRVGVMILPGKDCSGALEDLCLESVKTDAVIPCVNGYFECLAEKGIHVPTDVASSANVAISKAKARVFLASRKDPEKRLGEAAEAGYWDLDSGVFDAIKQFLQAL
ncbi:MAG: DUF3226 domain-containing protein [bacterium]